MARSSVLTAPPAGRFAGGHARRFRAQRDRLSAGRFGGRAARNGRCKCCGSCTAQPIVCALSAPLARADRRTVRSGRRSGHFRPHTDAAGAPRAAGAAVRHVDGLPAPRRARCWTRTVTLRSSAPNCSPITIISTPRGARVLAQCSVATSSERCTPCPRRREPLAPEGKTPVAAHLLGNLIGIGIPLEFSSYEFWIFVAVVAALFYCRPAALRVVTCCWWRATTFMRAGMRGTSSSCSRSPSPISRSGSRWNVPARVFASP